jgi:uncharacterized protein YndB with AHSA1/START domain
MVNSKTEITITALINAPLEKVWRLWTSPEAIQQWNFASPDWHCPKAENDLRVGGKLSSRMEARDGSFGFDFTLIYDEVKDLEKVALTMEDGRKTSTWFEGQGSQTKVTTTFDAETENPVELQKEGWQSILNNFKNFTETADL